MRHRILLQTDPSWVSTGLSENAKALLKYFWKAGKHDIAHMCVQGTLTNNPRLNLTPWKSFGCIPTDQNLINQINADPGKARDAGYGAFGIDAAVKDWKPTVWIGSNDIWSFPNHAYMDKPWYKAINSVPHITIDSIPVLDQAFQQAAASKYYMGWSKFSARAMKMAGPKFAHVDFIYGASDTTKYSPVPEKEIVELKRRFGIDPTATIFLMVGRNQLRKSYPNVLHALALFKRENPSANVKVLFHTAYHEQGQGWNLVKLAAQYGVNMADVLATYVCKQCKQWYVAPFTGEDLDCPLCGGKKCVSTVTSFDHSVPHDEMKYIYGLSNACISAFTSGGLEMHNVQSLLCGKPLACTNYSCGEDFCEQPFVFPLGFGSYYEAGNSFVKATTSPDDIKKFMKKVWQMTPAALARWGEEGQEWGVKTFNVDTIGAQWDKLFDSMPHPDWATIDLTPKPKNEGFANPEIEDPDQWLTSLYTNILKMDEQPNGDGRKHWLTKLKEGMKREDIYNFFIGVAKQENSKSGVTPKEFKDLFDPLDKKRVLYVLKESIGDHLIFTAFLKEAKRKYPEHSIYIACDPKYFEIYHGNPFVKAMIPYLPAMENEMIFIGSGLSEKLVDVYCNVALSTQKILNYLSNDYFLSSKIS